MRKLLTTAAISGLFILSCQNADSSVENISFDSSIVTNTKPVTAPEITPVTTNDPNIVQGATQTLPTNTNNAVTAPGMNPAHGQPGHRCDIAVGAPLNSPAATTSATQTVTQPVVMNTTPTKTLPGMNPPHGQPGHRCDIAVGAALNSAAVKPVSPKTDSSKVVSIAVPVGADTVSKQ